MNSNAQAFQLAVSDVIRAMRELDAPGIKDIQSKLGDEPGPMVVQLEKYSAKHARWFIMEYPMTYRETMASPPLDVARRIVIEAERVDEIGPPLSGSEALALAIAKSGRLN